MFESGYSDDVVKMLRNVGAKVFDKLRVKHVSGSVIEGVLLPRPEVGDPRVLVLKLDNGYNIGVSVDSIIEIKVLEHHTPAPLVEVRLPEGIENLPLVYFVGTGGTIASRIDYKTGAVYPFFSAEEIYSMVPELEEIAFIRAETLFSIFSEDMTPKHWSKIAEHVAKVFEKEKPRGIIIAHGTDTMGYTAAALAFALRRLPGPVILVGAQRSSDRPSSDAALNVIAATLTAIKAPFAESVVTMHGETGDTAVLVHRGVKVRKMHTSRRDAFRSVNDIPLAKIMFPERKIRIINDAYIPRSDDGVILENRFDEKVALIKFYPGMSSEIIDYIVDKGFHGIVLEGTGLGHVATSLIPSVRRAIEEGVPVVMTSQCLWGRINMNVYRTGVELLKAGVIPGEDMLPETAYVKLCWALGRTRSLEEVKRIMLSNIAYEINPRSENRFYPPVIGEDACR